MNVLQTCNIYQYKYFDHTLFMSLVLQLRCNKQNKINIISPIHIFYYVIKRHIK